MTTKFSLKVPNKQIETMEELVDSDLSLIVSSPFMAMQEMTDRRLFAAIKRKVDSQKTYITTSDMMANEKWIRATAEGRAALFLSTLSLKTIVIKFFERIHANTKFYFLKEQYRNPFLLTFGSSFALSSSLRDKINLGQVYHDLQYS